jgi:hypothetical protein
MCSELWLHASLPAPPALQQEGGAGQCCVDVTAQLRTPSPLKWFHAN